MIISNVLKCIQVKRTVSSNLKKHAVQDTQYTDYGYLQDVELKQSAFAKL